jgi:hypothetical protein
VRRRTGAVGAASAAIARAKRCAISQLAGIICVDLRLFADEFALQNDPNPDFDSRD